MYKQLRFTDTVTVPPQRIGQDVTEAVQESLEDQYAGQVRDEIGVVLSVTDVADIGDGSIKPEDASVHYDVECEAITFKPELHEVVTGEVTEITEFGAFIDLGPIEGLCHVSQIMDDYVSFNEDQHTLSGEDGDRVLQEGDIVKARVTAVSLGDDDEDTLNLTMRQPGLGKPEWIREAAEDEEDEE